MNYKNPWQLRFSFPSSITYSSTSRQCQYFEQLRRVTYRQVALSAFCTFRAILIMMNQNDPETIYDANTFITSLFLFLHLSTQMYLHFLEHQVSIETFYERLQCNRLSKGQCCFSKEGFTWYLPIFLEKVVGFKKKIFLLKSVFRLIKVSAQLLSDDRQVKSMTFLYSVFSIPRFII